MITGFNTDIEFQGKTYHVQTEDKGLRRPLILSLVYAGGEILASKRSPYDDLVEVGFDEDVLGERLKRQHKLICAAIQQGRIEDLKRMTKRAVESEKTVAAIVEPENIEQEIPPVPAFLQTEENDLTVAPILAIPVSVVDEEPEVKIAATAENNLKPLPARVLRAEQNEAVADFVRTENDESKTLSLRLLEEREFRGGERIELQVLALRGDTQPLAAAEVIIKILGSAFRPLIFHATTSAEGIAVVNLQLPQFRSGRAALLIKIESDGYTAELRRIVTQS